MFNLVLNPPLCQTPVTTSFFILILRALHFLLIHFHFPKPTELSSFQFQSAPYTNIQLTFLCGHKVLDRKSTRLNSSHVKSSYAVFCLKKKNRSTGLVSRAALTHPTR